MTEGPDKDSPCEPSEDRPGGDSHDDTEALRFLHDEGLEFLAFFRRVEDVDVRRSVMTLVRALAGSGVAEGR